MRKRWIIIGVSVGLLALLVTGGAALAWNEYGDERGRHYFGLGHGGGHEERFSALTAKVSDILGTDADDTANAMTEVGGEMAGEALESKLQAAIDSGRITEDEAQEIRDNFASSEYQWHGKLHKLHHLKDAEGEDSEVVQEFSNRVGAILNVSADSVSSALQQAVTELRSERLEEKLQAAIDSGEITEEEAQTIREQVESGDWSGFGKGRHGGKKFGKRGHRGWHGDGWWKKSDFHAPATAGDAT